jgi:hypothetical protein
MMGVSSIKDTCRGWKRRSREYAQVGTTNDDVALIPHCWHMFVGMRYFERRKDALKLLDTARRAVRRKLRGNW